MKKYILLFGMILISILNSLAQIPAALGWYQIPNTVMETVCPPNNYGGSGYNFRDQCDAVTNAWNSGVLDEKRNRLIIWGGGHHDYYGNEIYALDLSTFAVSRLTNPALPIADESTPESLVNGTQPNSRHTCDGIAYMSNVDKMFVFGGSRAGQGSLSNGTWLFNFATNQWEAKNPAGTKPNPVPGIVTAYDPNTGKVFLHDDWNLYTYTHSSNSFQKVKSDNAIDYHMTGIIDPVRKKLVIIGGGQAWSYDISGNTYAHTALNTTGGSSIVNSVYPGLAYDPVSGNIIAWNGGNTVYSLNLDNKVWTPITKYTGGPGAASTQGTFERWAYSAKNNVFFLVNHMTQNAYSFRLNSGGVTSIEPEENESIAAIYPNPSSSNVMINLDHNNTSDIQVIDMLGKTVEMKKAVSGSYQVNIENYESGLYLVRIISGHSVTMQKFIKE